jgi:hypothetical protein
MWKQQAIRSSGHMVPGKKTRKRPTYTRRRVDKFVSQWKPPWKKAVTGKEKEASLSSRDADLIPR